VTLAAIINTIVSLVVLGLGVWLVLVGAVGLALGRPAPARGILGDPLFIRVSIAMILVGLVLFFAGSIAAILFFLTIPFVLGRLFGVAAALAGAFAAVRDEPLRFGTRGWRHDRSAGAGEGAGESVGGAAGGRRHDEPAAPNADAADGGGDGGGGD